MENKNDWVSAENVNENSTNDNINPRKMLMKTSVNGISILQSTHVNIIKLRVICIVYTGDVVLDYVCLILHVCLRFMFTGLRMNINRFISGKTNTLKQTLQTVHLVYGFVCCGFFSWWVCDIIRWMKKMFCKCIFEFIYGGLICIHILEHIRDKNQSLMMSGILNRSVKIFVKWFINCVIFDVCLSVCNATDVNQIRLKSKCFENICSVSISKERIILFMFNNISFSIVLISSLLYYLFIYTFCFVFRIESPVVYIHHPFHFILFDRFKNSICFLVIYL